MSWAEEKTLEDYAYKLALAMTSDEANITESRLFTEDGTFVVPSGIFSVLISACASGKSPNAGEAILRQRFLVRPGEVIHFTCGLDVPIDTTNYSKIYKDTEIWSDSIGHHTLYAGTLNKSVKTDILGFETGISGSDGGVNTMQKTVNKGGYGGYFGYGGGGGGAGEYSSDTANYSAGRGGAGGGPQGGAGGDYSGANRAGSAGLGLSAGGGGGGGPASTTSYSGVGGNSGNGYKGGEGRTGYAQANPIRYYGGHGGGGAGGGYGAGGGEGYYVGSPSGGMVFIEW